MIGDFDEKTVTRAGFYMYALIALGRCWDSIDNDRSIAISDKYYFNQGLKAMIRALEKVIFQNEEDETDGKE